MAKHFSKIFLIHINKYETTHSIQNSIRKDLTKRIL